MRKREATKRRRTEAGGKGPSHGRKVLGLPVDDGAEAGDDALQDL